MPGDVETLMEMGFSQTRAEKALSKTGYKGVQLAMDWLFAHEDDPDIDEPLPPNPGHKLTDTPAEDTPAATEADAMETTEAGAEDTASANSGEGGVAKSLKCDDCGKLLRSAEEAELHAARTKHANFSESTEEIKPLTEEEKKEQMARLQEKLKQRRKEKEEQERQEALQREKLRRHTGKDLVQAKAKMEEQEMKKLVQQRKREKEDEKMARQRVRDQIEKDKRDRAAKFGKASSSSAATESPAATPAATPPAATPPAATPPAASPPAAEAPPAAKKEYDSCRLQIRLTNGQVLTQQFGAKESLAAVRLFVQMNRTDDQTPFNLMTTFPKRVFTEDEMERPLYDLGLVPSAVIMLSKK